jgi:hypothetical protein
MEAPAVNEPPTVNGFYLDETLTCWRTLWRGRRTRAKARSKSGGSCFNTAAEASTVIAAAASAFHSKYELASKKAAAPMRHSKVYDEATLIRNMELLEAGKQIERVINMAS